MKVTRFNRLFLPTQKEERGRQTPYIHNVKSMFNTSYDSVFFVATKPLS
jgi:hypothetical protein